MSKQEKEPGHIRVLDLLVTNSETVFILLIIPAAVIIITQVIGCVEEDRGFRHEIAKDEMSHGTCSD